MNKMKILFELESVLKERKLNKPTNSYTAKLLTDTENKKAVDRILEKLGEETAELIIAVKNNARIDIINESADLIYILMVLYCWSDIPFDDILNELSLRRKK